MIIGASPPSIQRVVIVGGTSSMGMGAACTASQAGAEVIAFRPRRSAELVETQAFSVIGALDHLLITALPQQFLQAMENETNS